MERRRFLALTGTGIGMIAGCSSNPGNQSPSGTSTAAASDSGQETETERSTGTEEGLGGDSVDVGNVNGWPMYSADAGNTGVADNPLDAVGDKRWTFDTVIGSPPVVADGAVYVGKYDNMADAEDNGLYALNAADGSVQWVAPTEEPVEHAPAVGGDLIYAKARQEVVGVDAGDGSARWRYELDERTPGAPIVANDAVYIPADDRILELDPADGTELQSLDTELSMNTPAVMEDTMYVSGYGQVAALSLEDGSQRWKVDVAPDAAELSSGTTVVDGMVLVGSSAGTLHALSPEDGSEQGVFESQFNHASNPAVTDDMVYVGDEASVYGISREDGEKQWQVRTDYPVKAPAVAGDTVYFGRDDEVHALDRMSGEQQWTAQTGGSGGNTPVAVDDAVYIVNSGTLYAIE